MEQTNALLEQIRPGMRVYGIDGEELGVVESIEGGSIRLLSHVVPAVAVARVDEAGVHLHIARAAFAAASPQTAAETTPGNE